MQTKREFSDDIFIQKQSFILESIKQNRNRVLFFLAFVLYVLLTVLGTTDRDFFFESGISFPLLNIKLPLIAFYVVAPIIIILIHFNVLYLYQEHQKLLQKHSKIKNFYSSMPLGIFDMPIITKGTIHTLIKIFTYLVIYIMPLLTLYIHWWHFNKYQSSFYSSLHLLYIAIDTLLLSYFLFATKVGKILSALLWVGFTVATLLQMAINNEERALSIIYNNFPKLKKDTVKEFTKQYYPHLELSGEHLVSFDYNQLKTIQSLEKSKPLALLQPPLNLENRSFKYANFSNALLVCVNLQSAKLQGANLESAKLQESDLQYAQLKGANLESANLQEVNLKLAQLQRANLSEAQLKGANLESANLQESDLSDAQLQRATLIGAQLQGAILWRAQLQGADLWDAELQGATLSEAQLQGVNLREAYLQGATLWRAQLQGAILWRAQLQGADLSEAQLQGAILVFAKLQGADLWDAELQGVDSCESKNYDFTERVLGYIGKDSNLACIDKRSLDKEAKAALIETLKEIYNKKKKGIIYPKDEIERIEKRASLIPDLSKAKTGSYTKEEAQKWIEEYKKATGEK